MLVRIRVQPRARRTAFAGRIGEEWKLHVAAPPVDGKANHACIEFFAQGLGIARSSVKIVSGQKSRHKLIELAGVREEEFLKFAGMKK